MSNQSLRDLFNRMTPEERAEMNEEEWTSPARDGAYTTLPDETLVRYEFDDNLAEVVELNRIWGLDSGDSK